LPARWERRLPRVMIFALSRPTSKPRISGVEAKLDKLDARVDKLVGSVDMLKWLFGFLAATNVAMLVRLATQ
jgi:hypothetical protein